MDQQLTFETMAPKSVQINQIFQTTCFGIVKVIAIRDEPPSPAYECVPLEFDHPFVTVFVLDEDLQEPIEL